MEFCYPTECAACIPNKGRLSRKTYTCFRMQQEGGALKSKANAFVEAIIPQAKETKPSRKHKATTRSEALTVKVAPESLERIEKAIAEVQAMAKTRAPDKAEVLTWMLATVRPEESAQNAFEPQDGGNGLGAGKGERSSCLEPRSTS